MTKHKTRIISGNEFELEEKINKIISEEYTNNYIVKQIIYLGDSAEVNPEDTDVIKVPKPMILILFEDGITKHYF